MSLKNFLVVSAAMASIGTSVLQQVASADVTDNQIHNDKSELLRKGNTGDTRFKFELYLGDFAPTNMRTSFRPKYNKSGVYEKTLDHSARYVATGWVVGTNGGGEYADHGGKFYDLAYNKTIHMTNYVLESGHTHAAIRAQRSSEGTNFVNGVWSPDSRQ